MAPGKPLIRLKLSSNIILCFRPLLLLPMIGALIQSSWIKFPRQISSDNTRSPKWHTFLFSRFISMNAFFLLVLFLIWLMPEMTGMHVCGSLSSSISFSGPTAVWSSWCMAWPWRAGAAMLPASPIPTLLELWKTPIRYLLKTKLSFLAKLWYYFHRNKKIPLSMVD